MIVKKGFTLIALLVVIAVIGILATVLFVNLGGAKKIPRANEAKTEINRITIEYESYLSTHSTGVSTANFYSVTGIEEAKVPRGANISYEIKTDPSSKKYSFCAKGPDMKPALSDFVNNNVWVATSKSAPHETTACPLIAL